MACRSHMHQTSYHRGKIKLKPVFSRPGHNRRKKKLIKQQNKREYAKKRFLLEPGDMEVCLASCQSLWSTSVIPKEFLLHQILENTVAHAKSNKVCVGAQAAHVPPHRSCCAKHVFAYQNKKPNSLRSHIASSNNQKQWFNRDKEGRTNKGDDGESIFSKSCNLYLKARFPNAPAVSSSSLSWANMSSSKAHVAAIQLAWKGSVGKISSHTDKNRSLNTWGFEWWLKTWSCEALTPESQKELCVRKLWCMGMKECVCERERCVWTWTCGGE